MILGTIKVRIKTNWLAILMLIPWTLFAFAGVLFNIFGMVSRPEMIRHMWFILFILILATIYGTNLLLWQFLGKYEISISNKSILIKFRYNALRKQKTIPLNKIVYVKKIQDNQTFIVEKIWLSNGGDLEIRYYGGNIKIGLGYNSGEIFRFEKEINDLIQLARQE